MSAVVRVELPSPLCQLAGVPREVLIRLEEVPTRRLLLDALERAYPALRGTIRDQTTGERRPFLRFFACQEDISCVSCDEPLPPAVARGDEPFLIIGAIAGG